MATEEDSFEQVSAARKERLRALRAAQDLLNAPDEKASGGEDEENGAIAVLDSKKPNWDLRRDVQKKLDKFERRTQKALYKLMEEQEGEDDQNGTEA